MEEQRILAAMIHDRQAWSMLEKHIDPMVDLSAVGVLILMHVSKYYADDSGAGKCDPTSLLARLKASSNSDKQYSMIRDVVAALTPEISSTNVALDMLEHKRNVAGDRLAAAIGARRPKQDIAALAARFEELRIATDLDTEPKETVETDWAKLIAGETNEADKIVVLPTSLNRRLGGGVRRGDHIVVFGRPNCGKSLFCINLASGFVTRGLKVLWIENEDRGNKVKFRFGRRVTGLSDSQMKADPQGAAAEIQRLAGDRFIYASLTPGTLLEVEALVREHRPDVFIVNQIRNLSSKSESFTRTLDQSAQRVRQIGKKYDALAVSVTQAHAPPNGADGYAKDRPILYMEDVDSSRTGIAASADVMLAVGTSREMRESAMACVNIAKSKYGVEEHFYCKVSVEIDKMTPIKEQA